MSETATKGKAQANARKPTGKATSKASAQTPDGTWITKYGPRRVRQEMPTLDEAIFAARGLTDNEQEQIEVAASLIGMPVDEVRQAMLKTRPSRRAPAATFAFSGRSGSERAVVVERKPSRRPLTRSWGAATGSA